MNAREKFYACTLANEAGCMEWQGAVTERTGYGKVRYEGRPVDAHRASWMYTRGPIPAGMDVCHTCDNRICVNPLHLFLGTRSQNMIDAYAKGRVDIAKAVAGRPVLIADDDVRAIHALASAGEPHNAIAARFGIARQTVKKIAQRQGARYATLLEEVAPA